MDPDAHRLPETRASALRRVLLPSRCLLCAQRTGTGQLCDECLADLPLNRTCCARCAEPLRVGADHCGACLRRPPAFATAWAPYRYEPPLDLLELRFKFGSSLAAGAALADLFVAQARDSAFPYLSGGQAVLTCVPMDRRRLRRRGYNQALELARPLARALQLPLLPQLLVRTRATAPQTGLAAAVRRRNLRAAFAVQNPGRLPTHVIIVDDVMTTGATLHECARVLRRAGVERVDAWALARAPAPR